MTLSSARAIITLAAATVRAATTTAAAKPTLTSAVAFRTAKSSFSSSSSSSSSSSPSSSPIPPLPTNIRRFPLPGLHVGTDICDVARIYAILGRSAGAPIPSSSATPASSSSSSSSSYRAARFVRRILTPQELPPTSLSSLSSSAPSATSSSSQLLAWLLAGGPSTTAAETDSRLHDATLWKAARFLAGRFAAKEAVIKAHPHLSLTFHQIRIVRSKDDANNGSGPPVALIRLPATADRDEDETLSCRYPSVDDGVVVEQEALLSISHDGTYATAVCIGFQDLGS